MRFDIKDNKLEALYFEAKRIKKYIALEEEIITVIDDIAAATDERELYALKGLHFEKLSGKRKGLHSLRLNDQFRLIVSLERDESGKWVLVHGIEDYHKG